MFIAYIGVDEVIVTTVEREPEMVKVWFTRGGRDLDKYDRKIYGEDYEAISFSSHIRPN